MPIRLLLSKPHQFFYAGLDVVVHCACIYQIARFWLFAAALPS